jgi:hypothetical protein
MLVCAVAATGTADTTSTLTQLQQQYQKTAEDVREGQAQLYRLEGAISILQTVQAEDAKTTASKPAQRK